MLIVLTIAAAASLAVVAYTKLREHSPEADTAGLPGVRELAAIVLCLAFFWQQIFQKPKLDCTTLTLPASPFAMLALIGLLGGATNTGFILATLHGNVLRATLLLYLAVKTAD